MRRVIEFVAIAAAVCLGLAGAAPAAEWGSLKGRFIVEGAPPQLPPIAVTKDQFCIDIKPIDETVVIGENNSLVNGVVFLRLARRATVEIHPDYAAQASEPVEIDNKACHFVPHIALVRVNQPLLIKNSDPVGHNTNIGLFGFNQIIPAGGETETRINRAAPTPAPVACNIHPFMRGYVLAQVHPYMAVSGEDGTFEIANIPAGEREFQFWHEAPGYLRDVKFNGGALDRQGRGTVTIAAGQTLDLGDIKVPAAILRTR